MLSILQFWQLAVILITLKSQTEALNRVYYIAAVNVDWDYAPSAVNKVNGKKLQEDEEADVFTGKGAGRIGRKYQKVVYREFTDASFTKQKVHDPTLGILGPVIKGEVGDVLIVHFKNMANRTYTMHSHGVLYNKYSEGSLYQDRTRKWAQRDDHVPPGQSYIYFWFVSKHVAPASGDSNCLAWIYHSHVDPVKDMNTGLVGPLITCKKHSLTKSWLKRNVGKEIVLLFNVLDENKSWLLDENLRANGMDPQSVDKEDEGFIESNLMHTVNGLMYGNLDLGNICIKEKITWYVIGIGNEVDIHTVSFHGNPTEVDHHRTDVLSLSPAKSVVASMFVENSGKWMISCQVADHYSAGMIAFYSVNKCGKQREEGQSGNIRYFYIAAEEVEWDYGPTGKNAFDGHSLNAQESNSRTFFVNQHNRIGGKYIKALYFEYEDDSFTRRKHRDEKAQKHLGILGPLIRAEIGDTIIIVFKNKASRAYSMHPHGVSYDKRNEGALYADGTSKLSKKDDIVKPGEKFTYSWSVPESYHLTRVDAPCVSYFYYSAVNPVKDVYSGLLGPLVICKKGSLRLQGPPKGFNREFFLYFGVMDENKSWYLKENMKRYCTQRNCGNVDPDDEGFLESNKMHQVNGFMYGNLDGLNMYQGEKILWHLIGMGTEVDMHTVYFQGNTINDSGNNKDTINALPGTFSTFTMVAENSGKWPLVCRTNDHYIAGMKVFYNVKPLPYVNRGIEDTYVRTYFIGIVEKEWDYAPLDKDMLRGKPLTGNGRKSDIFVRRGINGIGKVYKKVLYREFTDETFTKEKDRDDSEKHLGILGPMIIAEEGDIVKVIVKNMATRRYNLHLHALTDTSQQSMSDGRDGSRDNRVLPGYIHERQWLVSSRASPGPKDSPCITWAYYSNVDPVKDTNSGLVGPLITCRKGTLSQSGGRKDIDRAFALFFTVLDENESWYLDENIARYARNVAFVNKEDETFKESNKMHAINGYIYGNARHFVMTERERVDWYLIGLGNEVDLHTVHFHGQTFIQRTNSRHREDVVALFPGLFATLEMKVTLPGIWLLHCHVNDHIDGGMETTFEVRKRTRKVKA